MVSETVKSDAVY